MCKLKPEIDANTQTSLVAQLVKNPPAMLENWVRSLGWEDSPGEGKGYPLQYSWASLMAQLVKNPPAMQETWVQSLGWENSPGEGKGNPLQYSGLENSMDCIVREVAKSRTQLSDFHFHFTCPLHCINIIVWQYPIKCWRGRGTLGTSKHQSLRLLFSSEKSLYYTGKKYASTN